VTQFKLTDLIIVLFLALVAGYFIVSFLVPERVWKNLSRRTGFSRLSHHRPQPPEKPDQSHRPLERHANHQADPTDQEKPTPDEPLTEREAAEILGLKGRVTLGEIKAAYRNEISKYHPDKVTHLAPEFREMARIRTHRIRTAYEYFRGKYGLR